MAQRGGGGNNEIKIGLFGSLTGTAEDYGRSVQNGVEMATVQVNGMGGVLGRMAHVVSKNDRGRDADARAVVEELIGEGVVAILGEVASSRTIAAADVAQRSKVPLITPGATNPDVTRDRSYVFRVCFTDDFQGLVLAEYTAKIRKIQNAAVLYDVTTPYSTHLQEVFCTQFEKYGGRVIDDRRRYRYSEGDTDFRAQILAIPADVEAIFVPGYYTEVALIARQIRDRKLKRILLGADGWDSNRLLGLAEGALEGAYFTDHYALDDPDNTRIGFFSKEYSLRFSGEKPDANAALAYDAAHLLFEAIERAGSTDPVKLRDAIAATVDFPGVTGAITIDQDRNAVKPAVIKRISGTEIRHIQTVTPADVSKPPR